MNSLNLPHFAILSGLFGTAASVFGKFISYSDELLENIPIDINQQVSLIIWSFKVIFQSNLSIRVCGTGAIVEMGVEDNLHSFDDCL